MTTRLRITGRVQGVGYRAWMVREATALGIAGSVRNLADGSVEALLDGPAAAVAALVRRARSGPPHARVADVVETADATPAPAPGRFRQAD